MIRRLPFSLLFAFAFAVGACLAACESETGPGAPPRTNGCIDETCYDAAAAAQGDATDQ